MRDLGNIHLDDRRRRTLQQLQQQLQQQLLQPTGAPISQELINNLAANSPVIAVTYYRYLRFLPNNKVLVLRSVALLLPLLLLLLSLLLPLLPVVLL